MMVWLNYLRALTVILLDHADLNKRALGDSFSGK